jgi:Cu(I)/Ag(I) efflux system membrane protein CusA/SilA
LPRRSKFPPGYYVTWSGQFEYLERAKARLKVVVPVTVLIIFLLLYLNFRRVTETLIVMLSVPFALVGGLWLMWWLGFNLSVAVAVGFIALAGVAVETGVVMLIYLDSALTELQTRRSAEGRLFTRDDLRAAIMAGAVERVRPIAIMAGPATRAFRFGPVLTVSALDVASVGGFRFLWGASVLTAPTRNAVGIAALR